MSDDSILDEYGNYIGQATNNSNDQTAGLRSGNIVEQIGALTERQNRKDLISNTSGRYIARVLRVETVPQHVTSLNTLTDQINVMSESPATNEETRVKIKARISAFHSALPYPTGYEGLPAINEELTEAQKTIHHIIDMHDTFEAQTLGLPTPEVGDIVWCTYGNLYGMQGGVYLGHVTQGTSSSNPDPDDPNDPNPNTRSPDDESPIDTSGRRTISLVQGQGTQDNTGGKTCLEMWRDVPHPSFPLAPGDWRGPFYGLPSGSSPLGRLAVYGKSPAFIRRSSGGEGLPAFSARLTDADGNQTISFQFDAGLRAHLGIDLMAAYGAPVYAVADGVVLKTNNIPWNGEPLDSWWWPRNSGFGKSIVIDHGPLGYVYYAHLDKRQNGCIVEHGQVISAGERIGSVGDTYGSRAENKPLMSTSLPHLHLEWARTSVPHSNPNGPEPWKSGGWRARQRIAEFRGHPSTVEWSNTLDPTYLCVPTGLEGIDIAGRGRAETNYGKFYHHQRIKISPSGAPERGRRPPSSVDSIEDYPQADEYYLYPKPTHLYSGEKKWTDQQGREFLRVRESQISQWREVETSSFEHIANNRPLSARTLRLIRRILG